MKIAVRFPSISLPRENRFNEFEPASFDEALTNLGGAWRIRVDKK